jgi:type IV pilus assembly protein PilO
MGLIKLISKVGFVLGIILALLTYKEQRTWEETVLVEKQNQVSSKEAELKIKVAEVNKAEQFVADREQKKKQLFELREEVDRQAKSVPQKASLPEVLAELDTRADKTGLVFSRFAPQAEVRQRFLVLSPFSVKLRGTYTQIMSFVDAAANMERAVSTQNLVIDSPSAPKAGASILNAEATMVTYHIDMNSLAAATSSDSNVSGASSSGTRGGEGR